MLESITILDCNIPALPSFANALEATVGWTKSHEASQDVLTLFNATRLRNLHLCVIPITEIPLPVLLSDLRTLRIGVIGERLPSDLYNCSLPQLSSLWVKFVNGDVIRQVLNCHGLLIGNLTSITLEWKPVTPQRREIARLTQSLGELLDHTHELRDLSVNGVLKSIVIKLLWDIRFSKSLEHTPDEDLTSHILRGCRLINLEDDRMLDLDGRELPETLEGLAKQWNCVPPMLPWNRFVKQLMVRFYSHHGLKYADPLKGRH
jgi:hypothetical protein